MKISVIGAGTMGIGIVELCIVNGIKTTLYNRSSFNLEKARLVITTNLKKLVEKGVITSEKSMIYLNNLSTTLDLEDIKVSNVVIETIGELENDKLEILSKISGIVDEKCIITSNTSSLSLNRLSKAVNDQTRFLGFHFFNPANRMKLIEIIPVFTTSEHSIERIVSLVNALGKKYILCKSTPGFVVNKMARPFYLEGFRILEEDVASENIIDGALKSSIGFKMGPIELSDFIGQDINYSVSRQIFEDSMFHQKYAPTFLQKSLVDAGFLGKKNGRSFFESTPLNVTYSIPYQFEIVDFPSKISFFGGGYFIELFKDFFLNIETIEKEYCHTNDDKINYIKIDDSFVISINSGIPANKLHTLLNIDVFLLDISENYMNNDCLVFSCNNEMSEKSKNIFYFLMNNLGNYAVEIKDSPGLIVGRILSCLINETTFMIDNGICCTEDIVKASLYGVNYPMSIFEMKGLIDKFSNTGKILQGLKNFLSSERYSPHYSLI